MRDPTHDFARKAAAVDGPATPAELARQWQVIQDAKGDAEARYGLCDALMREGDKHTVGRGGGIATGSPHATQAGHRILADGGNAVDAAVGACFALMVADVVNTSIAGRAQILVGMADGTRVALDGATRVPAATPSLGPASERRQGFAVVPVPGAVRAMFKAQRRWGRLPLTDILQPAIGLAQNGFAVPPHLGALWRTKGHLLRQDPAARALFLRDDDQPYGAGERFRNPALAETLAVLAKGGEDAFSRGWLVNSWVDACQRGGGYLAAEDMARDEASPGETVDYSWDGGLIVTVGRQGWGHTIIEILALAKALDLGTIWPESDAVARFALIVLQAFDDRPQEVGTLRPKPDGLPLRQLIDPAFLDDRSEMVRAMLTWPKDRFARVIQSMAGPVKGPDQDTSHLSVVDGEGNAVALTTSIGPHFGAAVASRETGVLFAHSYRMASSPEPGVHDWTEMSPTLVFKDDGGTIAIGAAGSERIPVAVAQVLFHHIGCSRPLRDAVAMPRLSWKDGHLRIHCDHGIELRNALHDRGFPVQFTGRNHDNHLGIVQVVARHSERTIEALADPAYDGAAGATPINLPPIGDSEIA